MIYVSIDIETTGLDRENDQVLEVSAIIEDTKKQLPFEEIPKFSCIINHNRLTGSPYALNLNARIIETLKNIPTDPKEKVKYFRKYNIINPNDLGLVFYTFLASNGLEEKDNRIKIIVAGKNFASFDKLFLERIPFFSGFIDFGHKYIDPVTLYTDFINDENLPSLDECLGKAGINSKVTHKALDDAWDVIKVLRKKY